VNVRKDRIIFVILCVQQDKYTYANFRFKYNSRIDLMAHES